MTIEAMADAFQAINVAITGITAAPTTLPDSIPDANLPMAITLAGPGLWHGAGLGGGRKCTRTYVIRVYIAREDSANFDQIKTTAYALLERFGVDYRARATVGGAMVVQNAGNRLEDRGFLRTIAYGGLQYFGFEMAVTVQEGS